MKAKMIVVAVLIVVGLCSPAWALDGIVSHWKFDEGSGTVAYDSAGTNDGIIYGAAWTTGKMNGALSFDGSNDYVSVPHDTTLNITGDITISVWLYLNESAQTEAIVTKCVGNGIRNNPYDFRLTYSQLTLVRADASGHEYVYSSIKFPLGEWHHGLVRVENKVPDFYIDGVITGKSSTSVIFTKTPTGNTKPVLIGRRDDGLYFNDLIDDVRIYDRALSEEEIQQLYQKESIKAFDPYPSDGATSIDPNVVLSWTPGYNALSHDVYLGTSYDDVNDADTLSDEYQGNYNVNSYDPSGLDIGATYFWRIDEVVDSNLVKGDVWNFKTWVAPNIISWWKFDEGEGSIAYDSAGNNTGTVNGATWTVGKMNGALSFDGSNDYVSVPHDTSLNIIGDITISAWLYLNESAQTEAIVTKCAGNGSRNNPYDYRLTYSQLTLVRADASGHELVYSDVKFPLGDWHHGLVRVENKVPDFYIDGVITGKSSASVIFTKTPTGNTKPLLIGRRDDGLYFNDLIDDVRIYDRALSAWEILALYKEGIITVGLDIKPGSCPNPLNVKSLGVLPVAVLGSEDFDVRTIDAVSIRLAGVAPIRSSFEDVATPVSGANECECSTEGPDGFPDLTLKFETQEIVEAIGEVEHGDELVLQLTAVLSDETPIEGSDCVIIRGRHKPLNRADFNGDGTVDMTDFAAFAENWLQSSIVEY